MKQLALLISLVCLQLNSYAQYPTTIGTRWEYVQYYEDDHTYPGSIMNAFDDVITKDSVINNISYQKTVRTGTLTTWLNGFPSSYSVSGSYLSRVQNDSVIVLDSVAGLVNYEHLLFDFGMEQGDSLQGSPRNLIDLTTPQTFYDIDYSVQLGHPAQTWTVDSLITLYGDTVKTFSDNAMTPHVFWKEGIGCIHSRTAIQPTDGSTGHNYWLLRLTNPTGLLYYNPHIIVSNIQSLAMDNISISLYPNPSSGRLNLNSNQELKSIEVKNTLGQSVFHKVINTEQISLDLSFLHKGIYNLILETSDGLATRQWIIH